MNKEKDAQCVQLAREIFATIDRPKGIRAYDISVKMKLGCEQPFVATAYVDDNAYTFLVGYGETAAIAVADLAKKIPPPVTAATLREKAQALLDQAEKLENLAS